MSSSFSIKTVSISILVAFCILGGFGVGLGHYRHHHGQGHQGQGQGQGHFNGRVNNATEVNQKAVENQKIKRQETDERNESVIIPSCSSKGHRDKYSRLFDNFNDPDGKVWEGEYADYKHHHDRKDQKEDECLKIFQNFNNDSNAADIWTDVKKHASKDDFSLDFSTLSFDNPFDDDDEVQ
jgi:hypothetical protein